MVVPEMNDRYVTVLRYDPSKRYFLISAKLKEQVGALADLTRILAVRGFNILEGYFFVPKGQPTGTMTLIAEASRQKVDKDFVQQLLEGSSFIDSVEVVESKKGLIINSVNFPVRWEAEGRVLLLQTDALKQMFTAMRDKLGKEADGFLYKLGSDYARKIWKDLFSGLPVDQESIQYQLELYSALGFGKPEITRYKQQVPSAKISVSGSFECEDGHSSVPMSHFLRGALGGSFEVFLGRGLTTTESQCVAMGAKNCEFEISAKSAAG